MKNTLAQLVEYLLANLGIKQQDFARKTGFTQSYISQILSGNKTNPSLRFYESVSREYNVSPRWFRKGEGKAYIVPGEELPSLDAELIAKYRLLPRSEKRIVEEIINALLFKKMTN